MNIQWYPGHMTRTRREIEAQLKQVDMVAEVVDARIPLSSRNPDIDTLAAGKPRLIVLNKSDLADPSASRRWRDYFGQAGLCVLAADCKSGGSVCNGFIQLSRELLADKLRRDSEKGQNKPIRVMVCGIPNVGKSALINCLAGSRKTRVEDRPGVTRGRQWISVGNFMDIMDTAGVLWPKFDDEKVAMRLAMTGAIADRVLDTGDLALRLIEMLAEIAPSAISGRYGVKTEGVEAVEIFDSVCKARHMLTGGGEPDYERCSIMLLDEFRAGRLGRITLELPPLKNAGIKK